MLVHSPCKSSLDLGLGGHVLAGPHYTCHRRTEAEAELTRHQLGGPMWLAPIHNVPFVQRVLQSIEGQEKEYGTWPRIHGMLTLAANVSTTTPSVVWAFADQCRNSRAHSTRLPTRSSVLSTHPQPRLPRLCESSSYPVQRHTHARLNTDSGSRSALLNGGYKVSRSHAAGGSIKTDAPPSFIYDIVREHIKTNPVRMDKVSEGSPTRKAIAKPMT